ncbi:MAG: hypothetical protein BWX99_02855 [Deltaproteobacteria bacterium ADurb.Bin151]|nr:MAG: hypothetical protein BWX99_02855 [Deltaproteobacteria bacterium ADurb.Bin151]
MIASQQKPLIPEEKTDMTGRVARRENDLERAAAETADLMVTQQGLNFKFRNPAADVFDLFNNGLHVTGRHTVLCEKKPGLSD